jgi:predicted transcriptional regulator
VRGLARNLGRDVKRVHEDVVRLMEYGLIERREDGKYFVPYDVIHADFDLHAVA